MVRSVLPCECLSLLDFVSMQRLFDHVFLVSERGNGFVEMCMRLCLCVYAAQQLVVVCVRKRALVSLSLSFQSGIQSMRDEMLAEDSRFYYALSDMASIRKCSAGWDSSRTS